MESMTGYAFKEGKTDQFSFSVEIKTLNNRFLEVYINTPKVLRQEEGDFVTCVKDKVARGKVEINIEVYDWQNQRDVNINVDLLKKYYAELKSVEDVFGDRCFSPDTILQMEGVITRGRTQISKQSKDAIYKELQSAVNLLLKMRKKEGIALQKDLVKSAKDISVTVKKIEKMAKNVPSANFEKIKERLNKIGVSGLDESRLYTEVALIADKLDINEEIVRLNDHLDKFFSTVKAPGQIGKTLDFIAQELFREINTIASKSNNSLISQLAIGVKNNIDKIREQARNVV